MNGIRIVHSGGVGDGLMMSSVIKEKYCKEYDMVYLDVQKVDLIGCLKNCIMIHQTFSLVQEQKITLLNYF